MRTSLLLTATLILAVAFFILAGSFIFYAGTFTPTKTPRPLTNPTVQPTTAAPAPGTPLALAQARQLTSQQRLALLKKALENYERDKSDDYLCSLIAALTKDEISEASAIINYWDISYTTRNFEDTGIQDIAPIMQSRIQTKRIGEALSRQWGRVDPATWLETAEKSSVFAPNIEDAFAVMNGWFESEPDAALAWAQTAQLNNYETYMAAHAITLSAAGNPQKLADSLLAFPAGDERVRFCLQAYFNLIGTTTGNPDPATIYENIPAPLRESAWPIALERLTAADPQAAVDWLTAHVNYPGRDYGAIATLIHKLVEEDPSGTAQWVATLPDLTAPYPDGHPASYAALKWYADDAAAAKAWLQTQPSTLHWVEETRKTIEEFENPKEPEADKTEN